VRLAKNVNMVFPIGNLLEVKSSMLEKSSNLASYRPDEKTRSEERRFPGIKSE